MNSGKYKVLIIPSWYPTKKNYISGSFFQEQALLLQDLVDIKVLYGQQKEITKAEFYKKRVNNKIRNIKYFSERCDHDIISPPQPIGFLFDQVRGLSEEKNYNLMFFQYQIIMNELLIEKWKPDLIHAHSAEYAGIIAHHLGKIYSIPTLITEHQPFLLHAKTEFIRRKIIRALEGVNQVAAVSYHQLRSILMHDIRCNTVVTGNFIDDELFSLTQKKIEKIGFFNIISVTYPSFIKDIVTFFRAIAEVVKRGHTDILVTVIGNNSFNDLQNANTNEFEFLAKQYMVSQYCNFVSFVDRACLPDYYQESDLFVSTSIAETFGVAMREAMAAGIPVVTTANGGIDDTLNEHNGIKVNIRDYKALADAIIRVKTKAVRFEPEEVRRSVVRQYGKEAFTTTTMKLYQTIIDEYEKS